MGTRNITSVIMDGKQVVCQYGQWDGYPTYTGTKILEFLRDADQNRFRKALKNTMIQVTDYKNAVSYTGSTKDYGHMAEAVMEARRTLDKQNDEWPDFPELYDFLIKQGDYSEDDIQNYFVWTRDTGCDILPLIYNRSLEKPPLELAAMTHEYNKEYAWDIQGVNIIDLDNNKLLMTFDGYPLEFDIDNLPKDIEKTMNIYEKTVYQIYEKEKELDFTSLFPDVTDVNHADPAWDLVKEISDAICAHIQENDPELFESLGGKPYITEADQELIYTILRNKAEKRLEAAKEEDGLSVDAKIDAAETRANDTVLRIDGITRAPNTPTR